MARRKVNKSAKIRAEFDKNPKARPRDVVAALAARKIKVSPAQVSNIRSRMAGKRKSGKLNGGMIAVSDLQAAKKLVDALGSIERAQSAIGALARLQ